MENEALQKPERGKVIRKPGKKQIVIILSSALVGAAVYVLTGDAGALIFLIGAALLWTLISAATAGKVIITLIAAYVILTTPPLTVSSHALWKYPFQRAYIGLYQNVKEPDWFPDFERDVKGGYEFDYSPSVLQGTGHYSVYFETDSETAARYADEFGAKAQYSFTLSQYGDGSIYSGDIPKLDRSREGNGNISLSLYLGKPYGAAAYGDVPEEIGGARVYVLSSNLDFNHPHTSAVFIDTEKNAVFLSQLG